MAALQPSSGFSRPGQGIGKFLEWAVLSKTRLINWAKGLLFRVPLVVSMSMHKEVALAERRWQAVIWIRCFARRRFSSSRKNCMGVALGGSPTIHKKY
ncbi:hypothetical protein KY290_008044 [Solanum tuberosum]|uniref:Uncharacterized protein n=1 Tax=Solanum tuberosum TaxID=4113 RepID=A0ABQ7W7A7_SOLTU|nr:hypothetical protein KY290_008044 [Solanum tuberosum]